MARYAANFVGVTPVATADTADLPDAGSAGVLQGGTSTQRLKIDEVSISGEAPSASTVNRMVLARDSTVATGAFTVGRLALTDASATAPATVPLFGNTFATVQPQRSSTLYLLMPTLNTFGGIYRWQARQGEELITLGNTASLGEVSLSSISGTGVVSGHILFEVA